MWLWWMLAGTVAHAESGPLTIGVVAGPVRWMGSVPDEYAPARVGMGFGLDLGVPVKKGWTAGGGVVASTWTVEVPYALPASSRRKAMGFDAVTVHADLGRSWLMGERTHLRARGGPAVVAMVVAPKGGASVLECEGEACIQAGDYNVEDARVVVEEVEKEAPFGWRPGGFVSTGIQWQAIPGEQGLVLFADCFGVVTGRHQRSTLPGSQLGIWMGIALGG